MEGATDIMIEDHRKFMEMALEEAHIGVASGEQPFGAVVVLNGEAVCRSHSLKVSTSDTTAHAETLAIRYATQKLRRRTIPDAVFYSTCEPCPMCLGAVLNAAICTIILGARHAQMKEALGYHNYSVENFAEMTGWQLKVIDGVMTEECLALYRHSAVALTR